MSSQSAPASLNWPALQVAFADHPEFTRTEVLAFYHRADPSLSPNTLDSHIRQLLQRRLLLSVGRGRYTLDANAISKAAFQPAPSASSGARW